MRAPIPSLVLVSTVALTAATFPTLAAGSSVPVRRLEIVDRSIEHHGGDLYRSSETKLQVCSKSGCYDVRARLVDGLFSFEVSGRVHETERRVWWSNDDLRLAVDGEPATFEAEMAQDLRDWVMARVYFCFLPFRLNDPDVLKEDLGRVSWNGRELDKVKITFEPGSSTSSRDQYVYWLDPETGRVEQFAYSFQGNPGGLRFRRAMNHRRVEGILFFDQQNLGVEGQGLTVDEITPDFVAQRMRPISVIPLR